MKPTEAFQTHPARAQGQDSAQLPAAEDRRSMLGLSRQGRDNMLGQQREQWDDRAQFSRLVTSDEVDISHGPILYLDEVSVSFDGFKALNKLSLTIDAGELRCIIGPNGAGKTTMMDVITGKTRPTSGRAFFGQTIDLTRLTEPEIAHAGIGRKFQKPSVFERHSVFENLELAMKTDKRARRSLFAGLSAEQRGRIEQCLETIELTPQRNQSAGSLSHGQKQWLEIGMLLMQEPKLLMLDEPVAGMTDEETERTAELLKGLAGEHSIIVVEHDMDFVSSIARKVSVLHEGHLLAEGSMDKIRNDERVIEVYLGR
jgi:urea transport system ATP-binding protein